MAIHYSTGTYNNVFNDTGLKALFANGIIEIRTGSMPANADNAATGTLLGIVTESGGAFTPGSPTNGINFDTPVLRVLSKAAAEEWKFTGLDDGTAGWARFKANALDNDASSTTLPRIDMDIGVTSGTLRLSTVNIVRDSSNVIQSFTLTAPTP